MKVQQPICGEMPDSSASTPYNRHAIRNRSLRVAMALLLVALTLLVQPPRDYALMGGEGFMWSVLPAEPVKLVVCWENPDAAEPLVGEAANANGQQRREWVRLALKRNWERYARIIFVGWATCQNEGSAQTPPHTYGPRRPGTGDENIKIQIISSGGSDNPAHGSWGDYQKSGIRLNLHCDTTNNADLEICIEYLAIHEFGHVLGFYHEEERKDWPSTSACPEQWSALDAQGTIPPWWPIPTERRYGAADVASVMAYCSGFSTALSPGDVTAAQRSYQRHLPGTILNSVASLCLSGHAQEPNGDGVFGWECDEALDDQEWQYDWEKSALFIRPPASNVRRCLDVDTISGSNVQMWECLYGANQQWEFENVVLHGYGGLCLTRPAEGAGALTMQMCNGEATQRWRFEPGETPTTRVIRAESVPLCITVTGDVGSQVVVEPCSGNRVYLPSLATQSGSRFTAQREPTLPAAESQTYPIREFTLAAGGEIRPTGTTDKCLDVRDVRTNDYVTGKGGPQVGQAVQLFDCLDSQLNQKWNLTAQLVSEEKCLSYIGNTTINGTNARVVFCTDSIAQRWDYYW